MGKIGDLFVRLGLKSEDYKKGINDAKKETEGFGGKLGKMKGVALAAWAAIGAAVVKFASDFVGATNKMGDKWGQAMSGMKAGYQNMLGSLSNMKLDTSNGIGGFFKSLGQFGKEASARAVEAGQAAAEMTKAFDAEFELANSVRLQKGAIQNELNELYTMIRDTTLSPQARQAAIDRYKSLLEPIVNAEISTYSNMLDAAVKAWQAGNKDILSREYTTAEVADFFKMYGTNPNEAKAKYGELANVYENKQNDQSNMVIVDTLAKLQSVQAEMSQIDKEMGRAAVSVKKQLAEEAALLPNAMAESLKLAFEEIDAFDDSFADLELEIPEIDTSNLDKALDEIQQKSEAYKEEMQKVAELNGMLEDSIVQAMTGGMQAFTDMLMGIEGADATAILGALMTPFADTAQQLGMMLIKQGLGIEAFKKSLETLQGIPAIAAGTALLALSTTMRSGIQSLSRGASSGTGTSATYGGSTVGANVQNYESTLTIEVVGKISGNDINLSGKKAAYSNSR